MTFQSLSSLSVALPQASSERVTRLGSSSCKILWQSRQRLKADFRNLCNVLFIVCFAWLLSLVWHCCMGQLKIERAGGWMSTYAWLCKANNGKLRDILKMTCDPRTQCLPWGKSLTPVWEKALIVEVFQKKSISIINIGVLNTSVLFSSL